MIGTSIPSDIKALVLYGSHARGDSDGESDVDVCAFTADQRTVTPDELEAFLPTFRSSHLAVTAYSETDLTAMLEYGSLFLWHLRLEGTVVYGHDYFESQMSRLRQFTEHHSEIAYHRQIFDDLLALGAEQPTPNEFDLALLFTIARNTCMVLSHKAGKPAFGRLSSFHAAAREYHDLPVDEDTYLFLSRWKLVYERGVDMRPELPSSRDMHRFRDMICRLLEFADARTR